MRGMVGRLRRHCRWRFVTLFALMFCLTTLNIFWGVDVLFGRPFWKLALHANLREVERSEKSNHQAVVAWKKNADSDSIKIRKSVQELLIKTQVSRRDVDQTSNDLKVDHEAKFSQTTFELEDKNSRTHFDKRVAKRSAKFTPNYYRQDNEEGKLRMISSNTHATKMGKEIPREFANFDKMSVNKSKSSINQAVDTQGCVITELDPFDPSILKYLRRLNPITCKWNASLTYIDRQRWLWINQTVNQTIHSGKVKDCGYKTFDKWPDYDDFVLYQKDITYFQTRVKVVMSDFIQVYCRDSDNRTIYENIHAHIKVPDQRIRDKINRLLADSDNFRNGRFPLSIAILGIDSMSRSNFVRHLPKTLKYLQKKMGAFVFKGMNKIGDNTFPNMVAMLTGKRVDGSAKFPQEITRRPWSRERIRFYDDYPLLFRNFSHKNFVTMLSEDRPEMALFNYLSRGFKGKPTDHYLRPFYLAMKDFWILGNSTEHCFGDTPQHMILLEYFSRFIQTFHKVRFFTFSFYSDLCHEFVNDVQLIDDDLEKTLRLLHQAGYFENTLLIVLGDHGQRFDYIRESFVGRMEDLLPFFSMSFPKWFLKKFPKIHRALRINTERLVTFFDVYKTLTHFLDFKENIPVNDVRRRGLSLFKVIPTDRTCFNAGIDEHFCACKQQVAIATDSFPVIGVAHVLVGHLNALLENHTAICERLSLSRILDAHQTVFHKDNDTVEDVHEYTVVIETMPSKALFEATLKWSSSTKNIEVAGDISRVNKYGDQSICVKDAKLRRVCYCKNQYKNATDSNANSNIFKTQMIKLK
ncbi:uncharacterized protein LOC106182088 [Lingula anatina]|uniref:Uncharacterized protein LOC106182088 n=1 Tax=Lingula anatina TaxID=7574 RepID=A0A1S3KI64_LINAN|nr:uncharacterized protein LOC106182088 [Lingula anatina]|eukprot:XP_013422187.1 uncharacterized protein LOC106182088 [Lingula anatina]